MKKSGFTLVEVAVAGSLIGLCVLTAVSIIPAGLRTQNEARMRAAAAANVMSLSAEAGTGIGTVYNVAQRLTLITPSEFTALNISRWESNGAVSTPPSTIYRATTLPAAGDLARRLVYTLESSGGVRVITVWLLSKDPAPTVSGQRSARYLTTFVERA
jgi:type II secretory pathway pseudopilin PulG